MAAIEGEVDVMTCEGRNGFVCFLNSVLAFVFPVIPWEIFLVLPWLWAVLAERSLRDPRVTKGTLSHLILLISLFAAVYGGLAHPLGLIQAFESLGGDEGICVVHPPPMKAVPFKLYYGYKQHAWCYLLALHVIFVSIVGWVFLYLLIGVDRKLATGRIPLQPSPLASVLFGRCALWFGVTGISQAAPYWGVSPSDYPVDWVGGYSKRPFTPSITENLAAYSWIAGGIYFLARWIAAKRAEPAEEAQHSTSRRRSSLAMLEVQVKMSMHKTVAEAQSGRLFANVTFTMAYFLTFIVAQNIHHRAADAFDIRQTFNIVRDSVQVSGGNETNTTVVTSKSFQDVESVENMYAWLQDSFVPYLWADGEFGRGAVFDANRLIGGVRLMQKRLKATQCKSKAKRPALSDLYNMSCYNENQLDTTALTDVGPSESEAGKDGSFTYWLDIAQDIPEVQAHVSHLIDTSWAGIASQTIYVQAAFYNGQYGLFAFTEARFSISRSGFMKRTFLTFTLPESVYEDGVLSLAAWLDGFTLFCLSLVFLVEVWQLVDACRRGFARKFLCNIYRLATVFTILGGAAFCGLWYIISWDLEALGNQAADKLHPAGRPEDYLPGEPHSSEWLQRHDALNEIYAEMGRLASLIRTMQLGGFWYSLVVLMKIIEGFELSPRLAVVIHTFQECWVNLFYFMIVFLIIFCTFALGAHWLFGHMLLEWSGALYSISSSFRALMGDFDFMAMYTIAPVSAMCWFLSFMTFIYLVLINQFIAIIMDAYQAVQTRVEKSQDSRDISKLSKKVREVFGQDGQDDAKGLLAKVDAGMSGSKGKSVDDAGAHGEELRTAGRAENGSFNQETSTREFSKESQESQEPQEPTTRFLSKESKVSTASSAHSEGSKSLKVVVARHAVKAPTIMAQARPAGSKRSDADVHASPIMAQARQTGSKRSDADVHASPPFQSS